MPASDVTLNKNNTAVEIPLLLKVPLMIAVAMMFGGVLVALLQFEFGGLLFAGGLGLLSTLVGVNGLLRCSRKKALVSLVFIVFGCFLFWIILSPLRSL